MSNRFKDIDDEEMRLDLLYLELLDICGISGANKRLDEWRRIKTSSENTGFPHYVDPAFFD
jgi:hypothetical protein